MHKFVEMTKVNKNTAMATTVIVSPWRSTELTFFSTEPTVLGQRATFIVINEGMFRWEESYNMLNKSVRSSYSMLYNNLIVKRVSGGTGVKLTCVPQINLTELSPAPYLSKASLAASMTSGWL